METNRTLEILRTYNFAERNHWQLMADLSDNDYDISYFGGRVTINDDFEYFLQTQENNFNIHDVLDWLRNTVRECRDEQKIKNAANYQGCIDECNLLLKIVHQDYLIFNVLIRK